MKTLKLATLSLLLMAACVSPAVAQPAATDINPASLYYQAFLTGPTLSREESDLLYTTNWRGQTMTKRCGELLAQYDTQFSLVRRAAHSTAPCDWGIDWSQGGSTLLPQLARCKQIAQTARLRADWNLQNGRETEARDDLLATLALARNCAHEGALINLLVDFAIEKLVISYVAENLYRLSPETLQQLADGFNAAPPRQTMSAAITMEKKFGSQGAVNLIEDLRKKYPNDDAKVVSEFQKAQTGGGDVEPDQLPFSSNVRVDYLLDMYRDLGTVEDRLAAIMALPQGEYEPAMNQFTNEVQASTNIFAKLSMPAYGKARPKEFSIIASTAMLQAAIEYKLHGMEAFNAVKDPFGNGPFHFERFVFKGVDRGFLLKSAYKGGSYPEAQIYVEKDGPPFVSYGVRIGQTPNQ